MVAAIRVYGNLSEWVGELKMKIIRQDNFDDGTDERLVAIVLDEGEAKHIAGLMNKSSKRRPQDCFAVVADNYELKINHRVRAAKWREAGTRLLA